MPTRRVIRRCPFCGARISADDAQCPICGQQLRLSPAAHGSTQENVAGQNAAYPEPQLQLPPPRTLSIARQHALQHPPPTAPARRVRQARRITIRVDDPNNYVGPFEITYLQCPNCGGRANITDAFCGVCGYPLRANTPMQPQPKPIAVWSPRLQRPIPPAHFEVPLDAPDDYNSVNRPKALTGPQTTETAVFEEESELPGMDEPPTPASRRLYNSPTEMWAQITVLGMVALICLAGFWLFQLNQTEAKAEISASPATKPVSAKAPMRPHPQTLDSAKKAPAAKEPARMAALPATPTAMTLAATAVPSPTIPTLRILSPSVAYVVQPGDTCISIASLFSVTVANLIAHNKLDSAACFLHAGNKIYIPTPALQGTAPLSGTPTLAYAEPKLLLPLDNAKADGNTRLVTMTWASSVVLADNEYYVVHIQSAGAVGTAQFRTKLPTLILRPEMLENPASRSFVWWVSLQNVAGQEGTNKPGAFRELSPASEPRRFSW